MKHVIDVEDGEASVLRETGSGGLIGRGLLREGSLADYLDSDEEPTFVVRNLKQGYSVERVDDGGATEQLVDATPDGGHSAVALVTDRRVLFAAGRYEGDQTESVPLADVVDVRAEDGFLGGVLVVETIDDRCYLFPSRGDLRPVREFVDGAASIWARAERHLETAADALDRMERAFESGDADVVLTAVGDVRETLESARQAAASLDSAAAAVESRAADLRDRLTALERKASAEQADQARERGHTRWDDGEYEAAYDHFERADERYAAAQSVDADRPTDDLIDRRRAQLAADCERLAAAPLAEAEHAFETAAGADDLETSLEWWERALDRYETVLVLDWGREDRRFEGDREAVRERLATAAERLVEARCERARQAVNLVEDAPPEAATAARERASDALDAAHDLARERVPDAVDRVERLRDRLGEAAAETTAEATAEESADPAAGRETVVVTDEERRPDDGADQFGDDEGAAASDGDEWVLTDDEADDAWVSAERATTRVEASASSAGPDASETDAVASGTVDERTEPRGSAAEPEGSAADPVEPTASESEPEPGTDAEPGGVPGPDLASLGAEAFRTVVTESFAVAGWTTESAESEGRAEIRATTAGPLSLTAAVWTVAPDDAAAVDPGAVERFAATVADDPALDVGVVAAGARLPDETRECVQTEEARLVGPESLSATLDRQGIDLPDGSGGT